MASLTARRCGRAVIVGVALIVALAWDRSSPDAETTASPSAPSASPAVSAGSEAVPAAVPAEQADRELRSVERVIDGDTIVVDGGERVRLIGIDTPETKDPRRPVGCFGAEASAYMEGLLPVGTAVRLEYDVERRDRYGRTLAYVYRDDDGAFVNALLVRDGYAVTATYPPNVQYVEELAALAGEARDAGRGLWSACGDEAPAAEAATPTTSTPALVAAPVEDASCSAAYPTVCIPDAPPDLDCGDVGARGFEVRPPDPHRFDGDHDGVGCEG